MVSKSIFGTDKDGKVVTLYTIRNGDLSVGILDRGATIQSLIYKGVDVALGYDDVAGYEDNGGYLGATIGRYGNRIAGGSFTVDGKQYSVDKNDDGVNHLHGGNVGYNELFWQEKSMEDNAVTLCLTDKGADSGYPGTLAVEMRFSIEEDALILEYSAVGDEDTPVNLTNHCYFNLSGAGNGDILDTRLQILAGRYLPVDEKLIPTGVLRLVAGTPFDFTAPKAIGKEIKADDKQLSYGDGYDHNYCLDGEGFRLAVQAYSPRSGITMNVFTDEVGVQFYAGNVLSSTAGKGTANGYNKWEGFCLETQHYPDSPNQPHFPSTLVKAGETYHSKTAYAFIKEE
ncbi:MAG: galactose mutarotase [Clostridia bacterium]|nr:galactose mutarotase [Clostridia bacterium]